MADKYSGVILYKNVDDVSGQKILVYKKEEREFFDYTTDKDLSIIKNTLWTDRSSSISELIKIMETGNE